MKEGLEGGLAELLAAMVFGLGDAVGEEEDAVAGREPGEPGFVRRTRLESDDEVAFGEAFCSRRGDDDRGDVAAVEVFDSSVGPDLEQDHGGIFAAAAIAQELVDDL